MRCDFFPETGAVVFAVLPAFEHVSRVRVKVALLLASGFGISGHPSLEPVPHGSFAHTELTGNLFVRAALLAEKNGLLIARISFSGKNWELPIRAWFSFSPF